LWLRHRSFITHPKRSRQSSASRCTTSLHRGSEQTLIESQSSSPRSIPCNCLASAVGSARSAWSAVTACWPSNFSRITTAQARATDDPHKRIVPGRTSRRCLLLPSPFGAGHTSLFTSGGISDIGNQWPAVMVLALRSSLTYSENARGSSVRTSFRACEFNMTVVSPRSKYTLVSAGRPTTTFHAFEDCQVGCISFFCALDVALRKGASVWKSERSLTSLSGA